MPVILGERFPTNPADGWSQITGPQQIFYVSTDGNDTTGDGSLNAPFRHAYHAVDVVNAIAAGGQNYKPYWILLRKGDTFPDDYIGEVRFSGNYDGGSPGTYGGDESKVNPAIIACYDPADPLVANPFTGGNRPVIEVTVLNPDDSGAAVRPWTGGGNFFAVLGVELHAKTRDPFDASWVMPTSNVMGLRWGGFPCQWLLLEDVRTSWFGGNALEGVEHLHVRRVSFTDNYSYVCEPHVQGIYSDYGGPTMKIEESLLDRNGWCEELLKPQAVSVSSASPAVITWNGPYLPAVESSSDPNQQNGNVIFSAATGDDFGSLLGGVGMAFLAEYYLTAISGNTFHIGGAVTALGTITGGSGGTDGTYRCYLVNKDFTYRGGLEGHGCTVDIHVVGGTVTQVDLVTAGATYRASNVLKPSPTDSVFNSAVPSGVPADFSVVVSTVGPVTVGANAITHAQYIDVASSIYSHNLYIQNVPAYGGNNAPHTVNGNIIANASSVGCQNRPGGDLSRNLFIANPIAGFCAGTQSTMNYNVNIEGSSAQARTAGSGGYALDWYYGGNGSATGLQIGGASGASNSQAKYNITAHARSTTGNWGGAMQIGGPGDGGELVSNVDMSENLFYEWPTGTDPTILNYSSAGGNTISPNDVDGAGPHFGTYPYPYPDRTLGDYYAAIGNPHGFSSTTDGFLQACRQNFKGNWDTRLTADAVTDYFRENFGLEALNGGGGGNVLLSDYVLDNGLNALAAANQLYICSLSPADYTAVMANLIGFRAPSITGPVAAAPSGRKITIGAFNNGSVGADGTASHWALVDTGATRLLASGALASPKDVTSGTAFSLNEFDIAWLAH